MKRFSFSLRYACILMFGVALLSACKKVTTDTKFEGFTLTSISVLSLFLDDGSGGLGRPDSERLCIDNIKICFQDSNILYMVPKDQVHPWLAVCEPRTEKWRFFNTENSTELKCQGCSQQDLNCRKQQSVTSWALSSNALFELSGVKEENRTDRLLFQFSDRSIELARQMPIDKFQFGKDSVDGPFVFSEGKMMSWLQCGDLKCEWYRINIKTADFTSLEIPCNRKHDLSQRFLAGAFELKTPADARKEEICTNAQGQPVFPFAPPDPPVSMFDEIN